MIRARHLVLKLKCFLHDNGLADPYRRIHYENTTMRYTVFLSVVKIKNFIGEKFNVLD